MKRLVLLCILIALLIPAGPVVPAAAQTPQVHFKRGVLTIVQGPRRITLLVEVADTPASRARGLMFRKTLDEHAGMLFVFEETNSWGFWMKNTLIPLSIAFIDEDWRIVDIKDMSVARDPENGPFDFYQSAAPYRYALEVNQGFFKRARVGVGARVAFVAR